MAPLRHEHGDDGPEQRGRRILHRVHCEHRRPHPGEPPGHDRGDEQLPGHAPGQAAGDDRGQALAEGEPPPRPPPGAAQRDDRELGSPALGGVVGGDEQHRVGEQQQRRRARGDASPREFPAAVDPLEQLRHLGGDDDRDPEPGAAGLQLGQAPAGVGQPGGGQGPGPGGQIDRDRGGPVVHRGHRRGPGEDRLLGPPARAGVEEAVPAPVRLGGVGRPVGPGDGEPGRHAVGDIHRLRVAPAEGREREHDRVPGREPEPRGGLLAEHDVAGPGQAPPGHDDEVGADVLPIGHPGRVHHVGLDADGEELAAVDLVEPRQVHQPARDVAEVEPVVLARVHGGADGQ
ncbi:hypothetical protein [Dactylosporangium sp. CA-233914]|uniref:hypothetical protein n=1 Tax=Dactylosporangium sp. CA-233914 TaxID=3239934 RepID=UPI003D914B2F